MTPDRFTLLREDLGPRTLAYLLGADLSAVVAWDSQIELDTLGPSQLAVLEQLNLTRAVRIESSGSHPQATWSQVLIDGANIDDRGLGTVWRILAGGAADGFDVTGLSLATLLTRIAVDAYPSLLLHDSFRFDGFGMSMVSLRTHPLFERFQAAAMEDEVLGPLFTIGREAGNEQDLLYRSVGQGFTFQPSLFVDQLVTAAWIGAQLQSQVPTPVDLAAEVELQLERAREALDGAVQIPVRIGFTGVLLPRDVERIDLGWGTLRRVDERDRYFADIARISGGTSTTDEKGYTTAIAYSGDLVLETSAPYTASITHRPADQPWIPPLLQTTTAIEEAAETLRLALLLSTGNPQSSIYPTWRAAVEPFSYGRIVNWDDPVNAVGLLPARLTRAEVDSWRRWAVAVHEHRPHVGVAVRRLLQAINERKRAEDILVDAVIVWESLFGITPGTTKGVTEALDHLLHRPGQDQEANKQHLRDIYNARSRVVHGDSELDDWTLRQMASDAVAIAIAALQQLFESRTDLLSLPTAKHRNRAVRQPR